MNDKPTVSAPSAARSAMKNQNLISGLALLALAALLFQQTSNLTYITRLGPGPGFFPYWLSLALGLIALGIIWQSLRASVPVMKAATPWPARARSLATVTILALAALAFEVAGFRLTILVMLAALLPLFGYRQPVGIALLAFGGSFGSYALFHTALKVPLPTAWYGI
jgi:putative tricarboxylic transport membrane protein